MRHAVPEYEAPFSLYANALPYGLLLLDCTRRVVLTNPVAREILAASDAIAVEETGLIAIRKSDDAGLQAAIGRAVAASRGMVPGCYSGEVLSLMRRDSPRPYTVVVAPVSRAGPTVGTDCVAAMVRVGNPDASPALSRCQLCDAYGLTAREAEIAILIVSGMAAVACAAQLGISPRTARNVLQRVFKKTGVRRQSELVKLLLTSGLWPDEV